MTARRFEDGHSIQSCHPVPFLVLEDKTYLRTTFR